MKKDKEKISVFAEEETIVKKDGEVIEEKIEVTDKFDGYDDEALSPVRQEDRCQQACCSGDHAVRGVEYSRECHG